MDLKEEIRKLIELQELDSRIHSLLHNKDEEIPSKLEELKNNFNEKKNLLSSFEEKVKQLQLRRKDKELDLFAKEENVKKAQSQLYQLKTNKEYQAKLVEISSLKADVSLIEEDIINLLDELEKAERELNNAKKKLEEDEKKFKEEENRLKEEIKQLEIQINNLKDKRKIIADSIDSNILSTYERLLKTRSGIAIASVENENCSACHMRVTAQTINEIKMYKDLVFCEMCVRILYIKEDFS